jgi:hypothetical protein
MKPQLENQCLFKIQVQQRIARGHVNYNTKCYSCDGFDKYCDDYTPLKAQEELRRSLEAVHT